MRRKTTEKTEDFVHKRSLGQNFLTTPVVPNWMCEAANVRPGDIVLEIGPGIGALTKSLLQRGAVVHAIEVDARACQELRTLFAEAILNKQLFLHEGDVKELDLKALGLPNQGFKVVANIPYYLSGLILRLLLTNPILPSTIVLLMQREMVARIARDPKSSLLSLSVRAFGQPKYIKTVSRGHFKPAPKVDSAILQITAINNDNFADVSPDFFFSLLHLGLGKKRKQLLTNLKESFPKEQLETIFTALELTLNIRGEDLTIETWLKLARKLASLTVISIQT